MSVNSLLSPDGEKSWANLYVNTLTAYNGLTVSGTTKIGPAEKKSVEFRALLPTDKDPIELVLRNVGGLVNAEVEGFTHSHGTPVTYFFDTTSTDWVPPAETLDLPIWVHEGDGRAVGVLRVMGGASSNEIYLAKGINGDGSLQPFPTGDSGVSNGQSVVWSSAQ